MTKEKAISILSRPKTMKNAPNDILEAHEMAIKALEQEPCEDAISRKDAINAMSNALERVFPEHRDIAEKAMNKLPSVSTEKTGRCKECKYFEYDNVAKVDGIPLIVAHEICSRWGDGCKTREDGYCFLFEPQESEE